jgi:predicted Zn-dependent protease
VGWDMSSRWTRGSRVISAIALLMIPCILPGQAPPAHAIELQQHISKAEQALRLSDKSAAEREYNEILKIDPQNSQAWTGLGILLYGSGRPEEAIQALQSALKSNPGAKRAELFIGLSEAELHKCAQAIPILSKYFDAEPASKLQRITGLALLGCAVGSDDPLPALRAAERLKQLYPGDADVLYESAELYTRMWNQSAGELMAKHPDSYRVHQLAGEVYEAKNDYDQAIREYSLALQDNPKLPQMHYRIGQLYLHQGSEEVDEKAMEEFRREKEINPESAVSDLAMADIEMHRHQLSRAKPLYDEAARLDPTLTEARVGLAKILLEQHETDAAVRELRAIIAEHPEDAAAHYSLMRAYRDQKKMPEASAEMATFNRLQSEKADKFQNKMNALLNGKSTHLSVAAPVEESSPK